MKKIVLVLIIFWTTHTAVQAQHDLYAGAFTDFGVPINKYDKGRTVLGAKGFNFQSNTGLMVQYKAFNRVGIEFGISQNYSRWKMRDKSFASRNDGYKAVVTNNHYYWSYHGALQFFQPLSDETSLYLGGGVAWNQIGSFSKYVEKNFLVEVDGAFVNEDVKTETSYNSANMAYYGEVGIQQAISDNSSLSFGLKLNLGQSEMATGTYNVYNRLNFDENITTDRYTRWGDFAGLNVKYTLTLWHKDKKAKVPKIKPQPVVIDKKKKVPEPKPKIEPKPKPQPSKVEGRDVKVTNRVTVRSKTVKVLIWDHQEVDGDRVSLKLDEMWILQNYTLSEKKKEVIITLKPGQNFFVLHALNLGRLSPNTAAMIIQDGAQEHKIVLESTLQQSGTIEITYNP